MVAEVVHSEAEVVGWLVVADPAKDLIPTHRMTTLGRVFPVQVAQAEGALRCHRRTIHLARHPPWFAEVFAEFLIPPQEFLVRGSEMIRSMGYSRRTIRPTLPIDLWVLLVPWW